MLPLSEGGSVISHALLAGKRLMCWERMSLEHRGTICWPADCISSAACTLAVIWMPNNCLHKYMWRSPGIKARIFHVTGECVNLLHYVATESKNDVIHQWRECCNRTSEVVTTDAWILRCLPAHPFLLFCHGSECSCKAKMTIGPLGNVPMLQMGNPPGNVSKWKCAFQELCIQAHFLHPAELPLCGLTCLWKAASLVDCCLKHALSMIN